MDWAKVIGGVLIGLAIVAGLYFLLRGRGGGYKANGGSSGSGGRRPGGGRGGDDDDHRVR